MILTKFLKIAMLHVVLDWQKIYMTVLDKALFFSFWHFYLFLVLGVVAQCWRCGGSMLEVWWLNVLEVWWLNGSAPDCCPAVPGSNPASPQPTAD